MHQLIGLKIKLWVIIGLSTAISAFAGAFLAHPLAIGAVVGATEAVLLLALTYSWPLVTVLPLPMPRWMKVNLTGEWKGTIHSGWRDDNGVRIEPIAVTFDIKQSWLRTTFHARTNDMRTTESCSSVPAFNKHTGELEIRYFFRTLANAATAAENPSQGLGAAIAIIDTLRRDRIEIAYTNERGPGGNIELRRKKDKR